MLQETSKTYKAPCRSCGDYRVKVVVTMAIDPRKELVLGRCHSCGVSRCRYYRVKNFDPRLPRL